MIFRWIHGVQNVECMEFSWVNAGYSIRQRSPMWERSGAASKENCEAQFFRNSCRTRTMFHGQNGHTHESWTSQKRYSDKYIIVYTNGRTVQGQARPLSTSKVDIFTRAKVQGAFSTYRMLYLIEETITKSNSVSVCLVCATEISISSMWGIVGKCGL